MNIDSIDEMIKYTMCSICMVREGVCSPLTLTEQYTAK